MPFDLRVRLRTITTTVGNFECAVLVFFLYLSKTVAPIRMFALAMS
jgi:hypothetical protein